MKADLKGIKNIILDLGRVILKINLDNTINSFKEFGFPEIDELDIVFSRYPFFREFELGLITGKQFFSGIRKATGKKLPDRTIRDAWNSMIAGYIEDTIPLVKKLGRTYRMLLLSNTNSIHEREYNRQLMEEHGIKNLSMIFEKVYYSHAVHLSKPDPEIYKYVMNDSHLVAEETLFIDDILIHIESAAKLGIRGIHLDPPLKLTNIF